MNVPSALSESVPLVVVEATVVALLLALAIQAERRFGTLDPKEFGALRG